MRRAATIIYLALSLVPLVLAFAVMGILNLGWHLLKWLVTPKGVLVVFLAAGIGVTYVAIRWEPAGMRGNLTAEFAGILLGVAAIDGFILLLDHFKNRRHEGAIDIRRTDERHEYVLEIKNLSSRPTLDLRVHANPRWGWRIEHRSSYMKPESSSGRFNDSLPIVPFLASGHHVHVCLDWEGDAMIPGDGLWVYVDWRDRDGRLHFKEVLLQSSSVY